MGLLKVFLLSTIFFVLSCSLNFAQQIHFFSDHFRGGITGGGYNPANFDFTGQIDLNIPLGATVRKAYLFSSATRHVNYTGFPEPRTIIINGQSVTVSMNDALNNNYTNEIYGWPVPTYEMRTVVKDITHLSLSSLINITPPSQVLPPFYWEYYILVLYENNLLPYAAVDVYINTQNADSLMNYTLNTSMTLDSSNDIGIALNVSHFCDTVQDGSNVLINGNAIGLIGGEDYNTPSAGNCVGTTAGFYYENNSLFGLGDDTPDEFMSGPDALSNIKNFITNNQFINVQFAYQSNLGVKSNPINQLYLTYTTTCDTFSVSAPGDTTICIGSTLQLNASASNPTATYEWQPATGLSCTTCPNPIFTADSSMFYTVRIWNNDSCSVVRPVKINVREKPKFQSVLINPTICGSTTGRISVSASSAISYSLNNGTWQSGALFLNLAEGNYTVSILDAFGCQNDTLVTLGYQNATQAIFNVNPNAGAAPLSVQLSNQSVNANLFQWSINGLPFAGDLTNYTFDSSGVYVIQLIASNNFAYCADTAFLTVFVYDSLVVTIPNVFSPNGDGINDFYSLSANQDVSYNFQILNRWGTEIFRGNGTLQAGNSKQIWDGSTITDGVYFIHLKIVDSENQQYQFQEFITVKN